MGFFNKIKQGLGIGTLKVELQIPGQVAKTEYVIAGQAVLTAKSDQKIKSIKLRMVEMYTTGQGENRTSKEYELGTLVMDAPFEMQGGETRTVDFQLPFQIALSSNQALAEKSGALGALGKAAVFAKGEKSTYAVKITVDLEGVALDPSASKDIHLV